MKKQDKKRILRAIKRHHSWVEIPHTNKKSRLILSDEDLRSFDLKKAILDEANLNSCDLRNVNLSEAELYGANLSESNLNEANLEQSNLKNAILSNVTLHNANLSNANLDGADLTGVDLTGAILSNASLCNTKLEGAILNKVNLSNCNFESTVLNNATINQSNLSGALLNKVQLSSADINNSTLVMMIVRNCNFTNASLSASDLSDSKLENTDFKHARMDRTTFVGSTIHGCNFKNTNISKAKFEDVRSNTTTYFNADMSNSSLIHSDFSGCDFSYANLSASTFNGVNLIHATMRKAQLGRAVFDSRTQIERLKDGLSNDQFSECIFTDEIEFNKDSFVACETITIKLNTNRITPFNFAYFLIAIEAAYNNIYCLCTTKETELELIQNKITPYYQGVSAKDAVIVNSIRKGSILLELASYAGIAGVLLTLSKTIKVFSEEARAMIKLKNDLNKDTFEIEKIKQETLAIKLDNDVKQRGLMRLENGMLPQDKKEVDLIYQSNNFTDFEKDIDITNDIVKSNFNSLLKSATLPLAHAIFKYETYGYKIDIVYKKALEPDDNSV